MALTLAGRHHLTLAGAAYPTDDNIFDPAAEYGRDSGWKLSRFEIKLAPKAGFGLTKVQYPGPYYPVPEHQFLPRLRTGGRRSWNSIGKGMVVSYLRPCAGALLLR